MNCIKNEIIKNEHIKNKCIKNELIKKELIPKMNKVVIDKDADNKCSSN